MLTLQEKRPVFLEWICSVLVILGLALLTGCYESAVPLAPREQATVDSSLFGMWLMMEQDEAAATRMRIAPYDAHSYYVEFCCGDFARGRAEAVPLRAHLVSVDSVTFVNAQSLVEDAAPFLFFRFTLVEEGVLSLRPVGSYVFAGRSFATSTSLYYFLKGNLGHQHLYLDEELRFEKVAGVGT